MAAVDGEESMRFLSAADPPLFLSPSPDLSRHARIASVHLYSSLLPFCPKPKPPLDELLVGESFDAEQIWCQIDLLSRPIASMLRREIKRIERDPPRPPSLKKEEIVVHEEEEEEEEEEEDVEEEEEGEEEDESDGDEEKEVNGVEDKFLKIKELEEYLEKDEEREYGEIKVKRKSNEKELGEDDEEEDDGVEEDEDNEADSQFGDLDGDEDEDEELEDVKYEDFFGGKKKRGGNKKDDPRKEKRSSRDLELHDGPEELDLDDENDDSDMDIQENNTLSTHEKELLKIQSKIEQMEKANLEPKSWTMQGEVTAAKRPKNSALEVDLDFEHNMKPPPAVTEEFTASIEDLIKKRIIEGRFDDVPRASVLPSKPPKELKELDENKSKKGLAEIYEEEYAHQTGLASAPLSSSDEQKKEASNLFKRLCLKLDALSHFHFAPKPVIEDMSIQANVPALAMEEIAPVAVSDAAMLAPEEVFKGKGDIKEDTELTQAERKRRRANKKRKFKAERAKMETKRARPDTAPSHDDDAGNQDS